MKSNRLYRYDVSLFGEDNNNVIYNETTGFLTIKVRASRIGVMPYKEPFSKDIHYELKKPEELFSHETTSTMSRLPVTDEHPKGGIVNPENASKLMIGFTDSYTGFIENGYYLTCTLTLTDKNIIDKILTKINEGTPQEVSCGYSADVVEESGVWNGLKYDKVQTNIRFNHIALVSIGRAGTDVKLLLSPNDSGEGVIDSEKQDLTNNLTIGQI